MYAQEDQLSIYIHLKVCKYKCCRRDACDLYHMMIITLCTLTANVSLPLSNHYPAWYFASNLLRTLLNLVGFLVEFIPLPIISGFTSAGTVHVPDIMAIIYMCIEWLWL